MTLACLPLDFTNKNCLLHSPSLTLPKHSPPWSKTTVTFDMFTTCYTTIRLYLLNSAITWWLIPLSFPSNRPFANYAKITIVFSMNLLPLTLFINYNLFLFNLNDTLIPLFQSTPPQTVILHDLHFDITILIPFNHPSYDFLMLYMIIPRYHCIPLHRPFVPQLQSLHWAPLIIVLLWWLTLILVQLVVLTQAIFQDVHIKLREFKCYRRGSVTISFHFLFSFIFYLLHEYVLFLTLDSLTQPCTTV